MGDTNEGRSFFNGDGFWGIVVLFFIFAMFGGGSFGGLGNNTAQGALTRAELADGFNAALLQRGQNDLARDQFGLQREIMENRFANQQCCCQTQQNILQNRYDAALGQANVQREILDNRYNTLMGFNNMQARQDACCCELKTAIHAEAEATRALINQNTMQELRDSLQAAQGLLLVDRMAEEYAQADAEKGPGVMATHRYRRAEWAKETAQIQGMLGTLTK